MQAVFTIDMSGKKGSVVSKINTFKGLYSVIKAMDGKVKLCKLISARPTKDPSKISLSILVKPKKGIIPQKDWQMVRATKGLYGEIQFFTLKQTSLWGNI